VKYSIVFISGLLADIVPETWLRVERGQGEGTRAATRSQGHTVTRSHGHMVTRSHGHKATRSHGHMVTWSHGHMVIRPHPPGRPEGRPY